MSDLPNTDWPKPFQPKCKTYERSNASLVCPQYSMAPEMCDDDDNKPSHTIVDVLTIYIHANERRWQWKRHAWGIPIVPWCERCLVWWTRPDVRPDRFDADIDGEAANDQSGQSVAMSADGNRVAIGAKSNDGNGSNSGHVRFCDLIGSTWTRRTNQVIDSDASRITTVPIITIHWHQSQHGRIPTTSTTFGRSKKDDTWQPICQSCSFHVAMVGLDLLAPRLRTTLRWCTVFITNISFVKVVCWCPPARLCSLFWMDSSSFEGYILGSIFFFFLFVYY
jgi:hypothetical protein